MPTNVTLNGTSYAIPATGEGGWGTAVTNYLIALSSGVLQKAGGSFTLTAETDFGATYGLKSVYFKSRNTPATAGIFRLGNAEAVSWRNAANSADLDLKVNSSDILEFGGNPITTLALGSAHEVLTMNAGATAAEYAKLDNDNIAAAAAIDAAKIADASVSNTEFQYLNGVTSSIQTQFGAKLDDVATANDNEIPRFNANGQALQNSGVTIDDSNNMAGIANVIISGAVDAASASNLDIGGTTATTINIGRSGQTTVIKGDLQVEGTTTTVDSTVLDVADKNITINKGGNQASADGGGFTLEMSDATDVAMVYLSSLASRFKIGDVGSETEVMSVGAIQVITAQKAFDTQVWLKEITTPTTPDSGYRALYPKSDGKLYTLNDAGEEIAVGSGSGQGEINYITNSDAETNTSDWTATGLATIARTDTAGELLRGTYSFKLASTGAGTIYTDFTIPEADENKKLKIEHDLKEISGYAAGEWTLKVIKDPAGTATDITPATTDIPEGQGQFLTTFDCTDADTYRLIYTCTGATNGVTIDNVIVGPGKVVQGAIVTEWESFTPDWVGTPPTITEMFYKRRVGSSYEFKGSALSSSVGGSSAAGFTIPDSLTVDGALVEIGSQDVVGDLGSGYFHNDGATPEGVVLMPYASSSTVINMVNTANSTVFSWASMNANHAFGIDITVPIAEWAGSGTLNVGTNDVEYAYNSSTSTSSNTTSFGYGPEGKTFNAFAPSGTTTVDMRVRFKTAILTGETLDLQVTRAVSGDEGWVSAGSSIYGYARSDAGTTAYGMSLLPVSGSSTDIDVVFASQAFVLNNWSAQSTFRWRVVKTKAGSAVGFGLASATERGLVSRESSGSVEFADMTFSANTGSWTVTSGDVDRFDWVRTGKVVTLWYRFVAVSTASSPVSLYVTIGGANIPLPVPVLTEGFVKVYDNTGSLWVLGGGGVTQTGGDFRLQLQKETGTAFTTSTNLTYLYGTVTYEAE